MPSTPPHDDATLLQKLLSRSAETAEAWEEFLQRYSGLFLKIIWKYEHDYDEVMEKYLFVCSRIAQHDFAVLRRFKQMGENAPKFTTWICTVVRNLCIDAHRAKKGRRRLPRAIAVLPDLHKKVFELYFWKGLSVEEIDAMTRDTGGSAAEAIAEIYSILASTNGRLPIPGEPVFVSYDDAKLQATENNPFLNELDDWLAGLPDEERAVLRLRFWENMTAVEISSVLSITPARRINTMVANALESLRKRADWRKQ